MSARTATNAKRITQYPLHANQTTIPFSPRRRLAAYLNISLAERIVVNRSLKYDVSTRCQLGSLASSIFATDLAQPFSTKDTTRFKRNPRQQLPFIELCAPQYDPSP